MGMWSRFILRVYLVVSIALFINDADCFVPVVELSNQDTARQVFRFETTLPGWFDNLFPQVVNNDDSDRRSKFPEQYPASYGLNEEEIRSDSKEMKQFVRPLLKQTQLEVRPLQLAFDASKHGWNPRNFHSRVDGKGASFVLATGRDSGKKIVFGGYNPKGWSSLGGARPSVAAFLFYINDDGSFQKLRKVGGGGLACARDDPDYGIAFGPDGLVIALQPRREKIAASKLGPYFERGPEDRPSLFAGGSAVLLETLQVFVGKYDRGEEIPYSGAVMDMTSG